MSKTKEITIKEKKLGRQKAWGISYEELQHIELDTRLVGKSHLETVLHELAHLDNPEWSESKVTRISKRNANILWKMWYRRVDNRTRQPQQ